MKILPVGDYVVVKRLEDATVSKGGIFIPAVAQEKSIRAQVVAVGPGKTLDNGYRVEPSVKVGDKVLLQKWGGSEIKLQDVEHVFMRESELLAIIEEDEEDWNK